MVTGISALDFVFDTTDSFVINKAALSPRLGISYFIPSGTSCCMPLTTASSDPGHGESAAGQFPTT